MFARKSQTILSDHYTKLIDHGSDSDGSAGDGADAPEGNLLAAPEDGEDDFITLKRKDHLLDESSLPSSSFISKRKLKMGQSKKAMLSHKGNPSKLVFDDEGDSHAIYELGDEETFRADGDAEQQRKEFVDKAGRALAEQDLKDKERQREKKQALKRKRKDIEREVRPFSLFPFFPSPEILTASSSRTGSGRPW
jgi:ATP-dependent RNA helicase DDX10/DBP4